MKTRRFDSWWAEIVALALLAIPGFLAEAGVIGGILIWLVCVCIFGGLLMVFGRGSVIECFLATAIVVTACTMAYRLWR
jgi:hypothetical protein